jgi:TRAP-type C4-dicarboxylate transport system substrate-binding protein
MLPYGSTPREAQAIVLIAQVMREVALGETMKLRLLSLMLTLLQLPVGDASAQQARLKANLQFPISNPVFGGSLTRFKQEVERQSESAIIVEIFDKAQLFTDDQVIDAVSAGTVDIAMTAAQQFSYKAPLVGIIDQPFLFNFHALMSAAAKPGSEIRRLIDEAILAEVGARVLWWHALGNNVIFSKGRDVADPARMKDQRVGSPGKLPGQFVAACGGRPVEMTIEKLRDAYKDGALDMSVAGFGALPAYNLEEFVNTVTFTHHTPIAFLLVINEKRWQALSPIHRAILGQAATKVEIEISGFQIASEGRARAFAEKHNVRLQALTPDQVADWRACSAGMLTDYMNRVGDSARRIMDAYGKLRLDPCCSAAPGDAAFTRR